MRAAAGNDALIALFEREGYARVEPPILQPADALRRPVGRGHPPPDLRDAGRERPRVVPAARIHDPGLPRVPRSQRRRGAATFAISVRCSACGRARPASSCRPASNRSAGATRRRGRRDRSALALDGLARSGRSRLAVRVGDVGLLEALLDALAVAAGREAPAHARHRRRDAALDGARRARPDRALGEHAGLLAAIEGQAPQAARAFVEDVLAIAGIRPVGGRTAGEIAERFLARAATGGPTRDSMIARARSSRRYLASPATRTRRARRHPALAREAGLDLDRAFDALRGAHRLHGGARPRLVGLPLRGRFRPQSRLLHRLHLRGRDPRRGDGKPVVGGGRYDRLLRHLGAAAPVAGRRLLALARASRGRRRRNERRRRSSSPCPPRAACRRTPPPSSPGPGSSLAQGRGVRDYRGAIAGRAGRRGAVPLRVRDRARSSQPAAPISASPARTSSARASPTPTRRVELLTPARLRPGERRRRSAAGLDRRARPWPISTRSRPICAPATAGKLRVATKYVNLTRRFFAERGVADYRIVESLGATEGAPAAGRGRDHRRHHDDRRDARRERA